MSDESPRKRMKRERDPNSSTFNTGVLVQFTDRMPLPGSPEYAEFQDRLNRRRLELAPD